jgi:hypothetical protein
MSKAPTLRRKIPTLRRKIPTPRRKTPTPRRKTPTPRRRTPTPRKTPVPPTSVTYVIYCHGQEHPGSLVPIPYYKGQPIRLDYYVECGVKLFGGPYTLNAMCNANAVPILRISSGSMANNMLFTGDEEPDRIDTMGIYVCDKYNSQMFFPVLPDQLYSLLQIIDVILYYHSTHFSNNDVSFSISVHSCRGFENDTLDLLKEPIIMNPDVELANAFAKTLKIVDSVNSKEAITKPMKTAALKTLHQQKEHAELRSAILQATKAQQQKELADTILEATIAKQQTPLPSQVTRQSSRNTKRKHAELINPTNRRKTLMSTPKRTRVATLRTPV